MRRPELGPERYEVTIRPDGKWYVERTDRTGYDTVSMSSVASGMDPDQAWAAIAAQAAIEEDKRKRAAEAEREARTRRFTVDA